MSQRDHDLVLVVDFGAQYAQLIARRVREANVYSEIVPHTASTAEIMARRPKAIILSGGPSSVYEPEAPQLDGALVDAGTPVLGICYGFMAMAQVLGGSVARTGVRPDRGQPDRFQHSACRIATHHERVDVPR
jgi:GMP synthase (glutamine-hydrolysing)